MPGSSIGRDAVVGTAVGGAASVALLAFGPGSPSAQVSVLAAATSVVWRLESFIPAVPGWLRWAVFAGLFVVLIWEVGRWVK
jgi:uncharacterized BrkB/YihY/UPF0761 family membrane protein